MNVVNWRVMPVVLFFALTVFLLRGLFLDPQTLPSVQIGRSLPSFKLPRLDSPDAFFTSKDLVNQVILINVWASWCEACAEEQVVLLQLSRQGVPIYGINYKDKTDQAKSWLTQWGNPYQLIGEDKKGRVAIDLGVYGAPETFVVDKKGIIRYRHVGILTQAVWMKTIKPLMDSLEDVS